MATDFDAYDSDLTETLQTPIASVLADAVALLGQIQGQPNGAG